MSSGEIHVLTCYYVSLGENWPENDEKTVVDGNYKKPENRTEMHTRARTQHLVVRNQTNNHQPHLIYSHQCCCQWCAVTIPQPLRVGVD